MRKVRIQAIRYQIEAAHRLIKIKKCTAKSRRRAVRHLSLSFYSVTFRYTVSEENPLHFFSVDLATQSIDKCLEYEHFLFTHKKNWRAAVLTSKLNKAQKLALEDANFIFGTYQSLRNKPYEWFSDFNAVLVDEAHHASNKSCKTILSRCQNLVYAFGVTGTFPKFPAKGYENLVIQSYIGPLIYEFTANRLINEEKRATPIHILFQILDWATQKEKRNMWLMSKNNDQEDIHAGSKILKEEE